MAYNPGPGSLPAVRGKIDPPPAAGPAPGNLDRQPADAVVQAVTAAVERYLAQRGANPGGSPAPAAPAQPDVVAGAVDRYLQHRAPRPSAPACGCGLKFPATAALSAPAAPAAPAPGAPPPWRRPVPLG